MKTNKRTIDLNKVSGKLNEKQKIEITGGWDAWDAAAVYLGVASIPAPILAPVATVFGIIVGIRDIVTSGYTGGVGNAGTDDVISHYYSK